MEYINKKLQQFENALAGKKIAIIGLGVSNLPLLDYFYDKKANITVFNNSKIDDNVMEKINNYRYDVETGEGNLSKLKGFDIVFRSPSCLPTIPELQAEKENGAIITTEIEQVLKLAPCKVIGITGSEGKTTTTSLIYAILKKAGINCYLGGNIGNPLFTSIEKMKPDDIIVLELSSFQLMDMKISPDISVITNIFPEHLNVHKSYEEYQEAKRNIIYYQNENGISVLNKDNDITKNFDTATNGKVIFFSSKEKLYDGYYYDREDGYIKYGVDDKEEKIIHSSLIKLRGIHNCENICAALAATTTLASREAQIDAIKEFKGVAHRLEFVKEINGAKYFNDSIGTSPASTIAGLDSFAENIILLAGGADKNLDYTKIGEKIVEKVGTLILCGPTADKIESATRKALEAQNKDIPIIRTNNLKESILEAHKIAKEGDIVLLSPASTSFDAFKNFEERGNYFKDIVNSL